MKTENESLRRPSFIDAYLVTHNNSICFTFGWPCIGIWKKITWRNQKIHSQNSEIPSKGNMARWMFLAREFLKLILIIIILTVPSPSMITVISIIIAIWFDIRSCSHIVRLFQFAYTTQIKTQITIKFNFFFSFSTLMLYLKYLKIWTKINR